MNREAIINLEPTDTFVGYRVRCYENNELKVSRVYPIIEAAQDVKRLWEWGCSEDELDC